MNETSPFAPIEAELAVLCEQCEKPFPPRASNGGSKQRFCSRECRRAFHNAQRLNETPQRLNDETLERISETPHAGNSETVAAPEDEPEDESEEFKWREDVIVVPAQPAIAVYFNPRGEVVIRQESQYGDDDHFVYVRIQNLDPFINRLQRIARGELVMG